ncbi:hypothetical protein FRC06_010721 [Ceratobasidium sp. 370]|nr:hypothetical protein FRC06_010721 [Ceratobasidium sp. 370]
MGIIHGDLRARNVLISDDGTAKLTGFGSSVLERDIPERHRYFQFAPRWAAPERMFDDERSWSGPFQFEGRTQLAEQFADKEHPWVPSWPTTKSDVWSLALTVLEAMTDAIPFPGLSDLRVTYAVAEQMQTPSRPDKFISVKGGYDNILWSLLQSCWAYDPTARPTASAVRDIPLSGVVEHLVAHGCPDISQQIAAIDEGSKRAGRSSDVYWGKLHNGTYVAVKCLRALSNSDTRPDKVLKHTAHELYTWSISTHPNILELLGLTVFHDRLAMVSPWMAYGSLLSYIHAYPAVNRYELCVQIAEGLAYMHEQGIAHGDVKGDNVVVSDEGIAKLTDFGCATMKRDFPLYFTVTESLNYSVRWAAPELFLEDGLSSFETDVYALAMTILVGVVPVDKVSWALIYRRKLSREMSPTEIERIE